MIDCLFGPLGNMQVIPWPQTGAGATTSVDREEATLVSGGRRVWRAPTPYKAYQLAYKGGTTNLQHLLDCYSGVYGDGPFYMAELNFTSGNLLPTRWATASMLRHVERYWCAPFQVSASSLNGRGVVFTNNGLYPTLGPSQTVVPAPNLPVYLTAWGAVTGTAALTYSTLSGGVWSAPVNVTPAASPTPTLVAAANAVTAVKLQLSIPSGSSLTLNHINLNTDNSTSQLPGRGIGGVQFTNDFGANIVSKTYDRIGVSLNIVEIED